MDLLLQFSPIPLKRYRCIGHGLKMCMLFGHNPQFFCYFFHKKNLVIFEAKVNTRYLVYASSPTVLCRFL